MRQLIWISFVTPRDLHLSLTHRKVNRSFPLDDSLGTANSCCENVTGGVTVLLLVVVTHHDRDAVRRALKCRVTFLLKRKRGREGGESL